MKIMIPSEKAKILDENIEFNKENNSLVIGGNLEVDGVLKASGGEEVITSAQAVIDEGNPQLNLKQGENIVDIVELNPILANGEKIEGYTFEDLSINYDYGTNKINYAGIAKNGKKLTIVISFDNTPSTSSQGYKPICRIKIPTEIHNKLYPSAVGGRLDLKSIEMYDSVTNSKNVRMLINKESNNYISIQLFAYSLESGKTYFGRYEVTFLLSDNLAI